MPSLPRVPAVLPLSPAAARTALVAGRAGLAALYLSPGRLGGLAGLAGRHQRPVPLLLRFFATREAALSTLLATASPAQRGLHLKVGVAVDTADAVAGLLSLKERDVPARTAVLTAVTALGAVALGLTALSGEKG